MRMRYEYVVTAGEGIMLEHGVEEADVVLAGASRSIPKGAIVMLAESYETQSQCFHGG